MIISSSEHAKQLAVLVSSCDKYKDLWKPFFTLFWRYWPDCPFPIYLMTNYQTYPDERVTCIPVGEDRQWGSNCKIALKHIQLPYILYIEEESFLFKSVDNNKILDFFTFFLKYDAACLRLFPSPGPDFILPERKDIGIIDKNADYRISLQATIWEKSIFESLIIEGETGWDMELKGTKRSQNINKPFLSVTLDPETGKNTNPPLPYFSRVTVKGKLTREAIRLCEKEGISLDLSARRVYTWWETIWEKSLVYKAYINFRHAVGRQLRNIGLLKRT
ncbi:MAG: hypothetical protein ABSD46_03675 [Bacteroidota bacterium]